MGLEDEREILKSSVKRRWLRENVTHLERSMAVEKRNTPYLPLWDAVLDRFVRREFGFGFGLIVFSRKSLNKSEGRIEEDWIQWSVL